MPFLILSCSDNRTAKDALFIERDIESCGIDFINNLEYTEEMNVYTFRNFYNGAGVGLGDFNNDGFVDIFFSGNQVDNRLYLNLGSFQFKDITSQAGVASSNVWSTGVTVVDINGDGWLDIYVCKSGDLKGENRNNELFVNLERDIGNGREVDYFDRNRTYVALGYSLSDNIRLQFGYMHQETDNLGKGQLQFNLFHRF